MYTKLMIGILSVGTAIACTVSPASAESFSAKVVSVLDGDTFKIQLSDTQAKVILYGVDCPEVGQEYGQEARKFTNDSCYGKTVTIDLRGKDKTGRLIGVVTLPDGTNLNHELVRKGLAWWSDKFAPKDETLKQLHTEAKTAHLGLWSASNPIPPWIFRNGDKNVGGKILPK
jgi:micrococcal nuclease